MTAPPATDPRLRILDAAERAFADSGVEAASLRQIVKTAGVNLATVYYYFQSKEGLMAAVFKRRFGPVHAEHVRNLQTLEAEYRNRPIPLEKLFRAMLLPPLRLAASATDNGPTVMRLIGRVVADPNPRIQELLRDQHKEVREAYLAAIHRSAPHLSKADLWWRFEFIWGAFVFVLSNPSRLEMTTGGLCNPSDTDAVLAQMLAVFTAGFRAPSASGPARASPSGRKPGARRGYLRQSARS